MLEGGSRSESPVSSSVSLTLPSALLEGLSPHPSFDEMFYGNEGLWWSLASLLAPSWVSVSRSCLWGTSLAVSILEVH